MEHKNIVATIYLKDGQAVASMKDFTPVEDVYKLCQLYNDSGIDKIIIFDLSTSDEEHEKNIHTIENINRNIEIKVCAGGNINRLEDVKKLLYAGCLQVIFNASKPSSVGLAGEASARFWRSRYDGFFFGGLTGVNALIGYFAFCTTGAFVNVSGNGRTLVVGSLVSIAEERSVFKDESVD